MRCESCGADDASVWPVRRTYPAPAGSDTTSTVAAERTVLPEVEHWCFACLTHYPHEPA